MKLTLIEQTDKSKSNWDVSSNGISSDDDISVKKSRGRSVSFLVWKNVLLASLAVMLKNSGYYAIGNVQSTINSEGGLGVVTLAIVTGGGIVGGFLAGPLLSRFDPKWMYLLGSATMTAYAAANFYPAWAVFIPAGIFYGLGSGLAAVAIKVYLARLAQAQYSTYNLDADRVTTRVFMCEIIASKLSMIVGNLASSLFLEQDNDDQDDSGAELPPAPTFPCGAYYCNEDLGGAAGPAGSDPSRMQINSLTAFAVSAVLVGCLVVLVLVDPLRRTLASQSDRNAGLHGGAPGGSLTETTRLLRDRRLLLLLPSFLIFTAGDTFWSADFTKAFISCSSGVEMVGIVSMFMGVAGIASSLTFGMFNSDTARTFSLTLATILQMAVLMILLFWEPSPGEEGNVVTLSLLTAAWFLGSGIRASLLPALLAVVFHCEMESAFTHLHVWSGVASMLMFALSDAMCVYVKIYFLLALLFLGMTGYFGVELTLQGIATKRSEYIAIEDLDRKKESP